MSCLALPSGATTSIKAPAPRVRPEFTERETGGGPDQPSGAGRALPSRARPSRLFHPTSRRILIHQSGIRLWTTMSWLAAVVRNANVRRISPVESRQPSQIARRLGGAPACRVRLGVFSRRKRSGRANATGHVRVTGRRPDGDATVRQASLSLRRQLLFGNTSSMISLAASGTSNCHACRHIWHKADRAVWQMDDIMR